MECADFGSHDEHLKKYLRTSRLAVISTTNFIDHEDLEPFEGPLRQALKIVDPFDLADFDSNETT